MYTQSSFHLANEISFSTDRSFISQVGFGWLRILEKVIPDIPHKCKSIKYFI